MPYKDPEKQKEYMKQWRETYKNEIKEYWKEYNQTSQRQEYMKEYNQKNKEKKKEYYKEYYKKPQGKKSDRISHWKQWGIIFHDYDLLYDIYLSTTHCDFCKCELNQCSKSRKCLDHDHDINHNENVRGIVCHSCNIRDVLKNK